MNSQLEMNNPQDDADYNTIPVYKDLSFIYSIEKPTALLERIRRLEEDNKKLHDELNLSQRIHWFQQREIVKMKKVIDDWSDNVDELKLILAKLNEERKQLKLNREARKFQDENR
jgi:hypothetical protein